MMTPAETWQYVFTSGTHQYSTVLDVFRSNPGYLYWFVTDGNDRVLADALRRLLGPCSLDIGTVDVAAVLAEAKLEIKALDTTGWAVIGETYPVRHLLKMLGGVYDKEQKLYLFANSPTEDIVLSLVDPETRNSIVIAKLDPEGEHDRRSGRRARAYFDNIPDQRKPDDSYRELVSMDTKALLRKGLEFDIPPVVVDEQIIDTGMIVDAFKRKEKLFLVGSEAGSGKTFVVGAAARELVAIKPDVQFVYVTLRQTLIKQIQQDIESYGVLDRMLFTTYKTVGKELPEVDWSNTVLIMDEAHTAKNLGCQAGAAGNEMLSAALMGIYLSATPYEDPTEMGYLEGSGIFNPHGFESFAVAYGARVSIKVTPNGYGGTRQAKVLSWISNASSIKGAMAARELLQKRGIFTQRQKRLPKNMVSCSFHSAIADAGWLEAYHWVTKVYERAFEIAQEGEGNSSILRAQMYNTQKRVLEAAKIKTAIELAKECADKGEQAVIFIETKSARLIGNAEPYEEILRKFKEWESLPVRFRSYPPPISRTQLCLAQAFDELSVNISLPSIVDELVNGLGQDNTGIYVGAAQFDTLSVTDSSAEKGLKAWIKGDIPFLIATMSKGGTGLSLHPTQPDQPRTQIGINLPWKAYSLDQVSGRLARYGMASKVNIDWVFCPDIPLEAHLASRVGGRMASMGATVKGDISEMAERLKQSQVRSTQKAVLA